MDNWNAMSIALKRIREDGSEHVAAAKRPADAATLSLRDFAMHPVYIGSTETPLRLLLEAAHRTATRDPNASIYVRFYTRVGMHMYQVPAESTSETLRFGDIVRIDVLGVRGERKMQTDDVLHLTYDFSYLRAFPALEVFYVVNCNVCLGSHLFEGAPRLKSLYINSCDVFFVAADFDLHNKSGAISLVNVVDRTAA